MKTDDQLHNTKGAAKFLGVKPRTVEWWRGQGCGPPYFRVGQRAIRYRESDLRDYLESRRSEATDAG